MQQQADATMMTAPLLPQPPLTYVLVVLRSTAGELVSALPHVAEAISACLDYGLPQFWTIPRACKANLRWLLPRLAWHQSRGAAFAAIDPFYLKYQCRLGLVAAVKHGNLAMVEWLHEYCPSVLPYTGMIEAARAGQLVILKWLADHHERANGGCTSNAFSSAVVNGHLDAIKWLQEYYPNTIVNPYAELSEAIRKGHTEVVKYLYEQQQIQQFRLDITRDIEYAAEAGNFALVQWLSSNFTDSHDSIMLDSAARGGKLKMVQWLHACFPIGDPTATIECAATGGHLNIVKWLHSNEIEGCMSRTLDCAASGGHLGIVKWLHENKAEGWCSKDAMDNAAVGGHLEVIQWLHENRLEGCSSRAISGACENSHLEVAKWLFEHVTQECDEFAIDNAAAGGHLNAMKWLSDHSVGGGECFTDAMDVAAENGHLHVVQWLHEHIPEGDALRVIDLAVRNGHLEIVKWLFKHRSEGCTAEALIWAAQNGHFEIVLFLFAKLDSAFVSFDGIAIQGIDCIRHMEIVQWLYDKNPQYLDLDALKRTASYMPAVLDHMLGL